MNKILGLLIFLMFSASVTAFPASLHTLDGTATPSDPAVFEVQVENNYTESGIFRLGTFSPRPQWFYLQQGQTLEPGENRSFRITVTPGEYAIDQSYSFTVYAKSTLAENEVMQGSFNVQRSQKLILEDFNLNKTSYKPGTTVTGDVKIRSLSSNTIKDYKINIGYGNNTTTKTSSPILQGGTRELSFQLPVNEDSRPQTFTVKASVINSGRNVAQANENFTVEKIRKIVANSTSTNTLFSVTGLETVENRGNTDLNYTVNKTLSSYLAPITGFTKEPDKTTSQGSEITYYWKTTLEPGESFTVRRHTNYWVPAVALIGIVAALAGIKRLRNSVKISKTAEKTAEGLKVSIEIENISDKTFRDVTVEDFVPDIAEVDKNFEMARPTVRKTNEGTKLSWNLNKLESGDQRVLQYTVRPKVEVEGGVKLQEAVLKEGDKQLKKSEKVDTEFSP